MGMRVQLVNIPVYVLVMFFMQESFLRTNPSCDRDDVNRCRSLCTFGRKLLHFRRAATQYISQAHRVSVALYFRIAGWLEQRGMMSRYNVVTIPDSREICPPHRQ